LNETTVDVHTTDLQEQQDLLLDLEAELDKMETRQRARPQEGTGEQTKQEIQEEIVPQPAHTGGTAGTRTGVGDQRPGSDELQHINAGEGPEAHTTGHQGTQVFTPQMYQRLPIRSVFKLRSLK
jgi:hypothetical protein